MRKLTTYLLPVLLALAGCGGPKIVPNGELAAIFHDVLLVNSYVGQTGVNIDSLNIYEPIFAAHGYTVDDIQYTIGNFAKRKSASLSKDVVGLVDDMLKRESAMWRERLRLRDTLTLVARRGTARTVSFTPRIEVRRPADTALLRKVVEVEGRGSYEVSWSYAVDSLDRNGALAVEIAMEDSLGRRYGVQTRTLERAARRTLTLELLSEPRYRRLVVDLNGYGKGMTTPRMEVDSLRVLYMLPGEDATRALSRASWGATDSLISASGYLKATGADNRNHETHLRAPAVDAPGAAAR